VPYLLGETLANCNEFRPQENRDEGDRNARLLAADREARFALARASCVIDAYTSSATSYQEIACLFTSGRSGAVVVAATPSGLWQARSADFGKARSAVLERAVSSFTL
jgi:hypothetical protein